MSDLAIANESICPLPVAPLSLSLLVTSPIQRNIPFVPVTAVLFPLARVELPYAGLVVAGLDILMNFLVKRSLVAAPPSPPRTPSESYTVTLTLDQLADLIQRTSQGQAIRPGGAFQTAPSAASWGDEPLFPDHLSFSLSISGPFGTFDGTPDSVFNVPLFQLPGVPGNLIVSVITIIAQFLTEQANINNNGGGNL
ncbi:MULTISPECIES: hypothetical protein [Desulfitobacterium]|uniref:Uncharacterized protein n=3 Tax=Desulfitobacterium hafniense TaxID=49338 RepID=Q24SE9_DESHY|nr:MULTISPECIES: hypothetical protein [Desulfitobacterium]EHL04183.1 hypothetical protein HMPREF0322_05103 [Desulfitobacterium hafniense DP7]KTE92247.1 hypothetical protein AT727_04765 [Desulfitobacterium hafniense]MEA5023974.1 hypothetical protein [Desulfitobacterium hafniense]BAE85043.1 hypothetical protein DSY3254 [Desulfitobacterium hafniense Y51]